MWSDFTNEFRPAVWLCLVVTFVTNVAIWYTASMWQNYKSTFLLSNPKQINKKQMTNRTIHVKPVRRSKGTGGGDSNADDLELSSNKNNNYTLPVPTIETPYQNPVVIINRCLQRWKRKFYLSFHRNNSSTTVPNENVIFKNNSREKLTRLISNAQVIISRQKARASENQKVPPKHRKVSLVQVVFLEIALALGTPSLDKVGTRWLMRFLFMQYVFFCMITSQAYLGSLGSFMTYPNERGQIRTPEELYERNLKVIGAPQSKLILGRALSKRMILKKLSER